MNYSETEFNEPVNTDFAEGPKEKKNTNYKALITYSIAVVCLILGLVLPLFDGKQLLLLQLPDIVNKLFGTSLKAVKPFNGSMEVTLFGLESLKVDLMAWVLALYTIFTLLAMLAMIPVGLASWKGKKSANVVSYVFELIPTAILTVYLILVLPLVPEKSIDYSILIAFGGPLLVLIVQAFMFKKLNGFTKVVLFLLSAIALFAMFDAFALVKADQAIKDLLGDKLSAYGLYAYKDATTLGVPGISFFNALVIPEALTFIDACKVLPEALDKALFILGIILSVLVVLNFFFDLVGLTTKAKSAGLMCNLIRHGLQFLAFVAFFITVMVGKYTVGLLLIAVGVVTVVQTLISVLRFVFDYKKHHAGKPAEEVVFEETTYPEENVAENYSFNQADTTPITIIPDSYAQEEPQPTAPEQPANVVEVYPESEEQTPYVSPAAPVYETPVAVPVYETPVAEPVTPPAPPAAAPVYETPVYQAPAHTEPDNAFQSRTPLGEEAAPSSTPLIYEEDEEDEDEEEEVLPPYPHETDEFMDKLTNEEKYEFTELFINKSRPDIGKIPTYNVNGNNKKFYSAIFIYLGKIRPVISDGLLNKLYSELQLI